MSEMVIPVADFEALHAEIERLTHLHNLDHSLADLREAENERLQEALSMATGEPGIWLYRLIEGYWQRGKEIERLRADVDMWHRHYAGLLNEAHDEIERLRKQFAMSDSDEALMLREEVERLRAALGRVRDMAYRGLSQNDIYLAALETLAEANA